MGDVWCTNTVEEVGLVGCGVVIVGRFVGVKLMAVRVVTVVVMMIHCDVGDCL